MSRLLTAFALLGLVALNTACTPVGVAIGGAAMAGSTAMQERGFEQALSDKSTELSIQKKVIDADFETFQRVDVTVVEGRVLLTGVVPNAEDRVRVVESTWQTEGVVEVINEVLIGADVGVINTGYDLKIESALDLAVTLDRDVQAVNYIADATGGTLYLMGIAQNQAELDRVIAHARTIERVRRVVSYVLIKDSPERVALLKRLAEQKAQE
ncbi:BON domain-containing protein [Pacificispira sp.]|uniref:BON domain-containing protein n=1 Tax=Pacificispira sp. TaxID=2888761 RepID=UPI003BA8D9FD